MVSIMGDSFSGNHFYLSFFIHLTNLHKFIWKRYTCEARLCQLGFPTLTDFPCFRSSIMNVETPRISSSSGFQHINRLLKEARSKDLTLYSLERPWFFRMARIATFSQLLCWSYGSYVYIKLSSLKDGITM